MKHTSSLCILQDRDVVLGNVLQELLGSSKAAFLSCVYVVIHSIYICDYGDLASYIGDIGDIGEPLI